VLRDDAKVVCALRIPDKGVGTSLTQALKAEYESSNNCPRPFTKPSKIMVQYTNLVSLVTVGCHPGSCEARSERCATESGYSFEAAITHAHAHESQFMMLAQIEAQENGQSLSFPLAMNIHCYCTPCLSKCGKPRWPRCVYESISRWRVSNRI
jgi:hypothetical protein